MNFDAIPAELRERPRWIVWRWGDTDPKNGKRKKPPYQPANPSRHASSTKSATWGTFEEAAAVVDAGKADGIGFALEPPYVGVDLDEELSEADQGAIMFTLNSYSERSVSGTGHHVVIRANLNGHGRHPAGIGVFQVDRFFYFTGEHVHGTPTTIEDRPAQLEEVLVRFVTKPGQNRFGQNGFDQTAVPVGLDDQELLEEAFKAKNGDQFRMLWAGAWQGRYGSQSEADLALCDLLAFWTGGDPNRIDQLFRSSGLMRPKWERADYRARTIDKALENCSRFYSGPIGIEPAGIENQVGSGTPYDPRSPGGPPETRLTFQRLSVLVENAPPEPEWTWRGYLALYVLALLAGRPKVGKSTLVFALIAAAIRGMTFLGLPAKAQGVLLLTEERRDTLAEKARILGLMDAEVPVYALTRHDVGAMSWPEVVRQAMTFCRENKLDVLIVDTLDRWTGLRGDAENAAGAVNEAMEPLQFAAAAGLAVLALSHQRKSGGEFGDAVRGSNAFTGAVDVVIELERPSRTLQLGGHARVLRTVSRFSSTPEELFFELGDDGFLPIGDVAEKKSDAERAQTLDALEQHDTPVGVDVLAEEVDLGTRALRRRLTELQAQGLALRTGAGKKGDPYLWAAVNGADGQEDDVSDAELYESLAEVLAQEPE